MSDGKWEYDMARRSRAGSTLAFRLIASGYLLYLAWTFLRDLLNGSMTMPLWLAWGAVLAFAAAGIAFGIYAWKNYRRELEAAKLPAENELHDQETEERRTTRDQASNTDDPV